MDSIEAKVKKLLLLADPERGATEAEAINAAEKAQKLALKYGLELASISLEEGNEPMNVEDEYLSLGAGTWRRSLAQTIAESFGGKCVWLPGDGHKGTLHMFAPEGTVSSIIQTYRSLEHWITTEADIAAMMRVDTYVHGRTYKNSWIEGCVGRVKYRLREKKRQEEADSRVEGYSQALVKVSSDVDASRSVKYPRLVNTKRSRSVGDYGAYQKGKEAGNRADIGSKKINQ